MEGKRVGVIGGGQLAWMMAAEAPKLGIKLVVQTPNQDDPAVSRADDVVFASIDDGGGTSRLADNCDIITFENEFVDMQQLYKLQDREKAHFHPYLTSLDPLLDKYDQRSYLKDIGVPVPKFSIDSNVEDIASNYGFPVVLKARRHGYDGQGTFIIKNAEDLKDLATRVPIAELLVEEFIPFERELAIIAARNGSDIAVYPVTETNQENQVCTWTITPANVTEKVAEKVKETARTILDKLDVIGVFGIEFFLTKDNRVLVNEIAPRTHNSGHYTLDGCETSQFAMHLQAVTKMSLGSTALKSAGALMVNLLGFENSDSEYLEKRDRILAIPNSWVHWYGKSSRPGRKLGHVTVILNKTELTEARIIIDRLESIWYEK